MDKKDKTSLKKRYLLWLYKTTREALERIERKFTQLEIDRFILNELIKSDRDKKVGRFIRQFKDYIQNKEKEGLRLKYVGKQLKAEYYFLVLKLKAIEKTIIRALGKNASKEIKVVYEKEMIERILKSTDKK